MNWLRSIILPVEGSEFAGKVDDLYMFLIWLSLFFFLLIAGLALYSVVKFRHRPGTVTPHISHHTALELTWSIIPLLLCVGIFVWGFKGYLEASVPPGDAMEIQVTAQKWSWEFEYPDGMRALNEVHIPLNKPVKFIMSSTDVIHSFFVPTMRVKHDVLPNRYTQIWFLPKVAGKHHATCAEYCGKGHSDMAATVYVDDDAAYQKWLETGGIDPNMPLSELGKILYESKGCATCHTVDGSRSQGPTWKGLYGHSVKLMNGQTVEVDENYIRESMLVPGAKVVAGYENVMPVFQGVLREREINALIAFIKEQK